MELNDKERREWLKSLIPHQEPQDVNLESIMKKLDERSKVRRAVDMISSFIGGGGK